jgi:hypothetical protein
MLQITEVFPFVGTMTCLVRIIQIRVIDSSENENSPIRRRRFRRHSHFQHFQRIPRSEGKSSTQLNFFRQLRLMIVRHDSDDADDNRFCVLRCTLYAELCTVFIASMAAAQTAAAAIISPVPAVFAPAL